MTWLIKILALGKSGMHHNTFTGTVASKSFKDKLNDIFEIYENDFPLMLKQDLRTAFLVEYRELNDAFVEIEEGIDLAQKIKSGLSLIHMFAWKARTNILMGDIEEAEKNLEHADKIRREVDSVPWQLSTFRIGKFEAELYRMEESLRNGNSKELSKYRKK